MMLEDRARRHATSLFQLDYKKQNGCANERFQHNCKTSLSLLWPSGVSDVVTAQRLEVGLTEVHFTCSVSIGAPIESKRHECRALTFLLSYHVEVFSKFQLVIVS
eukprot:3709191-Amphidinium_carterae.1